ncbi:MAG: type II toxin-antitoxin system RelE/ParE family toxin [Lachnospiraceae bacterium]|nr:type II toxin-antitoxin system RelE/ParE family toxin [Lachnospiraceae bacterium]
MNKLIYSPIVRNKLKALKSWLTAHFDADTAARVLTGIMADADRLKEYEKSGTNIAEVYDIDTNYWYLFTHQHYLIYRIEPGKVTIVQMFHEREDFMMKLFGISGRTQESIDYWGE